MATLVLTTIGGAVGGPIGAMLGAAIGQRVDRDVLFRPKGRQGPRLTELAIQTSSYGTAIPKIFGRLRVAGSVIWSTDLIERRGTSRGGKGQPSTTSYSYSASFAVALSARAILDVGRVWADGKLLRGAAGDLKTEGRFRVHRGDEDQPVDPLIAALEGAAPAHRGIAYAVFEDVALGDFGNHIPSLTFEVIADAGAVRVGAIARMLAGNALVGEGGAQLLDGFSAYGDSVRGALEPLAEAGGAWFAAAADGKVAMIDRDAPALEIVAADAVRTRAVAPLDTVPRMLTLACHDPARDWQSGVQAARRPGAGRREERVDLPAALSADAARTLAARMLDDAEARRERCTLKLDFAAEGILPGSVVRIDDTPRCWRVRQAAVEADGVLLDLDAIGAGAGAMTGTQGRVAGASDLISGETILRVVELPMLEGGLADRLSLTIMAAGSAPGWRRAALAYSADGGATWTAVGATAAAGVLGVTRTPLRAGQAMLVDRATSVDVELASEAMDLHHADAAMLDRGANLALIGGELLQFGRAEPLGAGHWRLTQLWRGRRGTTPEAQDSGAAFTLIEEGSARMLALDPAMVGGTVTVLASGLGDAPGGVRVTTAIHGTALVPLSPVHLCAAPVPEGGTVVQWVRRSRLGWAWTDGSDVPLGEEAERYRVAWTDPGGGGGQTVVVEPHLVLPASETERGRTITVRQIGTHGESAPATLQL